LLLRPQDMPRIMPIDPLRVAQYVRMSTEHQRYSTQDQADAIAKYAQEHNMTIVRTYTDDGKSGLNLEGRARLLRLLSEVQSGQADFSAILVYDISRWGRFQDADESGYWEYVCKRAGVAVHYCAEQFSNDGSLPSVILKNLKRTMAGEYSRELSVKVFAGQCRLIELGYRQGGPAGYGLRRLLVGEDHQPKELLSQGYRKSLQTDRVILVPGPDDEQRVVMEIYQAFVGDGRPEKEIAEALNRRGVPSGTGRPWTRGLVHQILINPKYIGANVYNRKSFKLKQRRVKNPEAMWVRRDGAFSALVNPDQFAQAAKIIELRSRRFSDEEMLGKLRELFLRERKLSGILIDESEELPSSSVYRSRFGSLRRVYTLVGYTPAHDYAYIEINRALRILHDRHIEEIIGQLTSVGAQIERNPSTDILTVNQDFTVALAIARCRTRPNGSYRWLIRLEESNHCDVTIAARMAQGNQSIFDYYLLPSVDALSARIRLAPDNPLILEVYRAENLDAFCRICRRIRIGDAA
jgi:DNA invertase Pin-like site-specific DNA recombinase